MMNLTSLTKYPRLPLLFLLSASVCLPSLSGQEVIFSEDFESFPANAVDTRSTATDMSQISDWRVFDSSTQREASVRIDADGLLGPAGENQFLQFNIIDITWTTVHADVANLFDNPTTAMGLSFDFYEPTGGNGDAWIFLTQNHAHSDKPYSWVVRVTLNDGTLKVAGNQERVFEDAYSLDTAHSLAVFVNNSTESKTYTWEGEERVLESERIHLFLNGELLVDNLLRNRSFVQNVATSVNIPLDAFTLQNAPAKEGNFPGQNIYYDNFVAYDLGGQVTFTYVGREADAPWRAEALAAIDEHRKAPLTVQAVGADGRFVEGASIGYSMTRHTFDFSGLLSSNTFFQDNPNYERYRRVTEHYFNGASEAGGTRWPAWVGDLAWQNWSQEQTVDVYRWLKERNMNTRVLTTIYQGIHLPQFIRDKIGTSAQDEIPADVIAHLEDIMGKLGPYVDEWEIINETAASRNLLNIFGEDIALDWYEKALELAPHARLAINENSIVGGVSQWRSDFYFEQIKYLVDRGAPIHSIGFQGHHRTTAELTPPANLKAIYDRFSVFGIPIAITEFDLETADNVVQADYTRDFMIGTFAHPSVESFLVFGFWAREHWRPHAAMFNMDWSPKPNFFAYHNLVYRDWWTRLTGESGALGAFSAEGFHGAYNIMAMEGNQYGRRVLDVRKDPLFTDSYPAVIPMRHTAVFPRSGNFGRILAKGDFSDADIIAPGSIGTVGYQGDGRVWHSFLHYPLGTDGLTAEAIEEADRLVLRTGAWSKILAGETTPLGGADLSVWAVLQPAPASSGFSNSFDFANMMGAVRLTTRHKESIRMLPDPDGDRVVDPVLLDIEVDLTEFLKNAVATAANTTGMVLTIGLLPADVPYFNETTSAYNVGDPRYLPQRNVTFSLARSFIGIENNAPGLFQYAPWMSESERVTWMGTVHSALDPYLYSNILGWIYTTQSATDDGAIYYDFAMDSWMYSTADSFPWMFSFGAEEPGWRYMASRSSTGSWYFLPESGWEWKDHTP